MVNAGRIGRDFDSRMKEKRRVQEKAFKAFTQRERERDERR
jgi:hypothetical protein